jgi:hypothetical protein
MTNVIITRRRKTNEIYIRVYVIEVA